MNKNEDVRNAVLEYLGSRQNVAQTSSTIWRKLHKENPTFSVADVDNALNFLTQTNPSLVKFQHDPLGSTKYYQATTDGILYIERNFGL